MCEVQFHRFASDEWKTCLLDQALQEIVPAEKCGGNSNSFAFEYWQGSGTECLCTSKTETFLGRPLGTKNFYCQKEKVTKSLCMGVCITLLDLMPSSTYIPLWGLNSFLGHKASSIQDLSPGVPNTCQPPAQLSCHKVDLTVPETDFYNSSPLSSSVEMGPPSGMLSLIHPLKEGAYSSWCQKARIQIPVLSLFFLSLKKHAML